MPIVPYVRVERQIPGYVYGFVGLLLLAPILYLWAYFCLFVEFYSKHVILFNAIYLVLSLIVSYFLCGKFDPIQYISYVLSFIPFAWAQAIYALPYVLKNQGFWGAFEWVIVTVVIGGISIFVIFINKAVENRIISIILSIIFVVAVCLLVRPPEGWLALKQMYHL